MTEAMNFRQLISLLFSFEGAIGRAAFGAAFTLVLALFLWLNILLPTPADIIVTTPLVFPMAALIAKRARDRGRRPSYYLWPAISIAGALAAAVLLPQLEGLQSVAGALFIAALIFGVVDLGVLGGRARRAARARARADAPRTVIVAAGGTGGHMFPAQAFAQEMRRRGWRVALITDARGARYAERFPADARFEISAATFAGRGLTGRISAVFSILAGVMQSLDAMRRLRPGAVAGFGGYPSLPAMAAAFLSGRPRFLHEQNAVLGRVNRLMAPRVDAVATAFEAVEKLPAAAASRVRTVGNPVRDAVRDAAQASYAPPGAADPLRLLIFGGSQGARILSERVPAAIALLPEALRARLRISHQVRDEDRAAAAAAYRAAGLSVVDSETLKNMDTELFRSYDKGSYIPDVEMFPFFADLPERIARAHLIVARSGASTVTEIAVIGRPAILVPLAIAMDDHQTANARALAARGAAEIIAERELSPEALATRLEALLRDSAKLAEMAAAAKGASGADAAARLADLAEQLARAPRLAASSEA